MESSTSWNRRLRHERMRRNWRQQDLADQLGTALTTIKRWERGRQHPSAYFRVKLCALFGVSAQDFGFVEPAPQPLLLSGEAFEGPEPFPALPGEAASSDHDEGWQTVAQPLRRQVVEKHSSKRARTLADRDWDHMLRRLRRSYKELLDQSLHGLAWMELGLSKQPDLVSNVTNLLFRLPQGGERLLPSGTDVLDAYDEAEGELLILGDPGAGKSTLLVDLAQQLVDRAEMDQTQPLPVILRLSSWALHRPALADWMVEQLAQTYDVPRQLGARWVTQGRLLPLLDGLDEVEEGARPACISAINTYHRVHLAPLVVCSRHAVYEGAAQYERLALQSAVIVQPLTSEQIEGYLDAAGSSFAGVREALHERPALWELATTPLMLSVLLLTYRGASADTITRQETNLERQVWTDYVSRMAAEKGDGTRYPLAHTNAWLRFLAQQLRTHQHTTFSAEYLDISWLPPSLQGRVRQFTMLIASLVVGCCISLLVSIFMIGYTSGVSLLQMGVLGGFVGACSSPSAIERVAASKRHFQVRTARFLRRAALLGTLIATSFGFALSSGYGMHDWLRDGSILGLGSLLSGWAFQVLIEHQSKQIVPVPQKRYALRARLVAGINRRALLPLWQPAVAFGIGIGLSFGLIFGLSLGLRYGLSFGLIFGLSASVSVILARITLTASLSTLHFAERIHWSWHDLFQPAHLWTTMMVAMGAFLFYGVSYGVSYGLGFGWHYGLSYGLVSELSYELSYGLNVGLTKGVSYGVIYGVIYGMAYWLLLGLYQGMKQEHLEGQNRSQFNQGIRRSLRNGFFLSLMSTILITAIGLLSLGLSSGLTKGLSVGLSIGLNDGVSVGLSVGVSVGLSVGVSVGFIMLAGGMVVMWALCGGPTILRHYVIRAFLARHQTFPFRAAAFLDDATNRILLRRVGGGYSFIHRRLQDAFVDGVFFSEEQVAKAREADS